MVSRAQNTWFWLNKRPLHTFGACNRSTHPGNNQEFFFSFKSHFSLIIFGIGRPKLLQGENQVSIAQALAWPRVWSPKGSCFPNIHISSGLAMALPIPPHPRSPCCLPPSPGADDDTGELASGPVCSQVSNAPSLFFLASSFFLPAASPKPRLSPAAASALGAVRKGSAAHELFIRSLR